MRQVIADDTMLVASDLEQRKSFRAYLVELQLAVIARRHAQSVPAPPPADDLGSTLRGVIDRWNDDLRAMNALKERFDPASGSGELGDSVQVVDLALLSPVELTEYQTLIGNLITWTDFTRTRLGYFDAQVYGL